MGAPSLRENKQNLRCMGTPAVCSVHAFYEFVKSSERMKASFNKSGMSSAWMRPESLESFSLVSSQKAIDNRDARARVSKTASRATSSTAAPIQRTSRAQQRTETNDEPSAGLPATPSRKPVANASKTHRTGETGQHCHQWLPQRTSSTQQAVDHVRPR